MYSNDTHFLLELIQNADDNKYEEDVTPTLHFTVDEHAIRIDCNEKGFTEDDVRAICRIGGSTKLIGAVRNFIGEKGIGFKAVFKAADRVYIRSNGYTFMFDTTKHAGELGMLIPIWTSFPAPIKEGYTQFLLQLRPGSTNQDLIDRLSKMESTMLLFLQSLQCIKISLPQNIDIAFNSKARDTAVKASLKSSLISSTGSFRIFEDEYLRIESIMDDLPSENRRVNVLKTQIVLAFALHKEKPAIKNQLVYAFLPIKDFGFQASALMTNTDMC